MHETPASEEEDTRDFSLRETERLKFITERSVGAGDEGDKKDKKDKKGEMEEPEAEEAEETKEEELTPQQQLYNHYLKVGSLKAPKSINSYLSFISQLEDEVLVKMGIRKAKVEQGRKSSIGADRRKSSLSPALKSFLKP